MSAAALATRRLLRSSAPAPKQQNEAKKETKTLKNELKTVKIEPRTVENEAKQRKKDRKKEAKKRMKNEVKTELMEKEEEQEEEPAKQRKKDRKKEAKRMKNEVKMEEMKEEEEQAADVEMADASKMHGYERLLDVNYTGEQWAEARVLDLDADAQRLFVHYMGWNARYDAWVGLDVIAAHGTHTKATPKKKTSWEGKQSLFEAGDGPAATHSKRKRPSPRARSAKPKAESRKRKASTDKSSAQADPAPGKNPRAARKQEKQAAEETPDKSDAGANASPKPARVTRSRTTTVKLEPASLPDGPVSNAEANDGAAEGADDPMEIPSEGEKVTPIKVILPSRRRAMSKQKSRKKKNDDESSASEYSDHEVSEYEEEDDVSDDEELRELRNRRKEIEESDEELTELIFEDKRPAKVQRVSARRGTSKAGIPHQRVPLACAESAATRERLADYFRQRVFQQQLMQVACSDETAPVVPITLSSTNSTMKKPFKPRKTAAQSESKEQADSTAVEATVSEAQLVAYYHYQMMLAQAYMTADPKELQARAAAYEQQRQLQVQEYYRQLESMREKNAKSIDEAQEFMATSAETWEKQSHSATDSSSSGDASALRSWDEMAKSLQNEKADEDGDDSKASKKLEGETDGEAERDADKSDADEESGKSPEDAAARELVHVGEQKADAEAKPAKTAGKGPSGEVLYEFVL